MNKKVLLPTCIPDFSTYHYQLVAGVAAAENPRLRNWFLNNCIVLRCSKGFLMGATTFELALNDSEPADIPHLERFEYNLKFLKGYIHELIKNILNCGYYVWLDGVDDYYVEGKSWYQQKHFYHDCLICGYDEEDMTYSIMGYDERWICCLFKTPQDCIEKGIRSMFEQGVTGKITALKAKNDIVDLDIKCIIRKLSDYLNSDLNIYSPTELGTVFGHAVYDYLAMYLDRLYDGVIPFFEKDRRMFRMLWEHKKCMLKRIQSVEKELGTNNKHSTEYKNIVDESNMLRMMYARYIMKMDNELLPVIKTRLLDLGLQERKILRNFLRLIEREVSDNDLELYTG